MTSQVELQDALRAGSRQSGAGRRFRRSVEALVIGQIAIALLVLSAAGLITRSLMKLERVELAFEPSRLLIAELALPTRGSVTRGSSSRSSTACYRGSRRFLGCARSPPYSPPHSSRQEGFSAGSRPRGRAPTRRLRIRR